MNCDVPIPFEHPFGEHDLSAIETLREIMAALRDPATGCPWDVKQNFSSIAPYTLEEAYEVADAIQRNDMRGLREELGDLLLQVVYHAQMADEAGEFSLDHVVQAICMKMIRRHPHVFGDEETRSAGIAKGFWEQIKAAEKAASGKASGQTSILDDVPLPLPALTSAEKLQKKAAKAGFDWPDANGPAGKLDEEITELSEATAQEDTAKIREEFGDLLFAAVNLARHHDVDPEDALRQANAKFKRRFGYIESSLRGAGRDFADTNLDEMDRLWTEAKSEGL